MKQKLLAILAAASLIMPYTTVFAARGEDCASTNSCKTYTAGQLENFLINDEQVKEYDGGDLTTGVYGEIIEDKGASSQYAKVLFYGLMRPYSEIYLGQLTGGSIKEPKVDLFAETKVEYGQQGKYYIQPSHAKTLAGEPNEIEFDLPTTKDFETMWGATYDQTTKKYTIDVTKIPDQFKNKIINDMAVSIEIARQGKEEHADDIKYGLLTGDVDKENKLVYVVLFDVQDGIIKGATMEQVPSDEPYYFMMPVVSLDKTYICSEQNQETYSCYTCSEGEYSWLKDGEQAETCQKIAEIDVKSKCVKNAKTGVKDYMVEFVGIVGICAVALVITKRKDLFKSI